MKTQVTLSREQLGSFAAFLETHPGFYPELEGENATVCGFCVGGYFITIAEMDGLVSSQPRLEHSDANAGSRRSCAY